jgi:hypothetical protein
VLRRLQVRPGFEYLAKESPRQIDDGGCCFGWKGWEAVSADRTPLAELANDTLLHLADEYRAVVATASTAADRDGLERGPPRVTTTLPNSAFSIYQPWSCDAKAAETGGL